MKKHYVQPGAIENLVDAVAKLNLNWYEQEEILSEILDNRDVEFAEAPNRTINAYSGRVYIIKASIHGEATLGIGIPGSDYEHEDGEINHWNYMHIYPHDTPIDVRKIWQITDEEVVDVVAGGIGSQVSSSSSIRW